MLCFVHFDFDMWFAPQRRALFRHRNFQKWSEAGVFCTFWLRNVQAATTACTFSTTQLLHVLRSWSVLYILAWKCASRPPEPQIIGKTQCFTTFLPFRAPGSSFFSLFLFSGLLSSTLLFSLTLPVSAFHLSILSEVWLLNFLLYSLLYIYSIFKYIYIYILYYIKLFYIICVLYHYILYFILSIIYIYLYMHQTHIYIYASNIYIYIWLNYFCKYVKTHIYIYIIYIYIHTIFSEKLMSKIHGFPMKSPFFPGFPAEGTGNHWLGEQSGGGWEIGDGRLVNTLKLGFPWDLWWFVDVHFKMRDFIGFLCFFRQIWIWHCGMKPPNAYDLNGGQPHTGWGSRQIRFDPET